MLTGWLEAAKLTVKVQRQGSRSLQEALARVQELANASEVAALRERVAAVYRKDPASAAKYAWPRKWTLLNGLRVAGLDLDKSSGLRILDIGCGPGYFVALARELGHDCRGVDAPASYLTEVERDVYSTLVPALGCGDVSSPLLIERFKPLPFRDQPFDLITAFWICFNRHQQPDEWGVAEWKFFMEDALSCLRPGGRMVLELNENSGRYGALRFYDQALQDYFCSVGKVDGGRIVVHRS